MYETNPYFYGTGRRKKSVARVRVYAGSGKITINNRDIDELCIRDSNNRGRSRRFARYSKSTSGQQDRLVPKR